MNLTGQAKTEVQIQDLSVIYNTGIKGIVAVVGITERGPVNEPTLIGSWLQFTRVFGGLLEDSDFPLLCRRALEAGAKLKVSRIAHYDDISDPLTIEGVASSKVIGTTNTVNFKASSFGVWGNKVSVTITDNSAVLANTVNISVELDSNPDLTETYTVPNSVTTAQLNQEIANSYLLDKATVTGGIEVTAKTYLENGTNPASYSDTDFIGDVTTNSGMHSFDNTVDCTKICVPEKAVPAIDIALLNYVDTRKDMIAVLRTPVGLNGSTIVDYRNGTGTYSHTAYNTWRGIMTTGGLTINHPETGEVIEISEVGDVLGLMSTRDNQYAEWFAFSGPKRGKIRNALGVVYNLGSAARQLEADNVDVHGINAIIEHPSFGVVAWGNSTLQKEDTLLKHANVAELLVYLTRALKPVIESELFEPNDIQTWKTIHRKVTPIMDSVREQRGIHKYLYQGDQDIDNISQAQINSSADIDAGRYVFHLFIAPKVAVKYLGVKVVVTNSGVDFESLTV